MVLGRRQGPQPALFSKAQGEAFRGKPASKAAAVHFLGRGFWKFLLLVVCISDLRIKALWSLLSLQGCETPVGAGRRAPRPLKFGSFQSFRGGQPWLQQHPASSCPEGASHPPAPGGLSLQWVRGRRQRPLRPRPSSPRKSPFQSYPMPRQGCRFSFGFSFPALSVRPSPSSTRAAVTPPGGGKLPHRRKAFSGPPSHSSWGGREEGRGFEKCAPPAPSAPWEGGPGGRQLLAGDYGLGVPRPRPGDAVLPPPKNPAFAKAPRPLAAAAWAEEGSCGVSPPVGKIAAEFGPCSASGPAWSPDSLREKVGRGEPRG